MLIGKTIQHNGKEYVVKVDSKLEWLWPYVKLSKRLGIPVHRIRKIRGYYVNKNKLERQVAQCACYSDYFIITLLRLHQKYVMTKGGTFKVDGWYECSEGCLREDTLQNLAHELSHTVHLVHSPERLILEMKIMLLFARYAKRIGYRGY